MTWVCHAILWFNQADQRTMWRFYSMQEARFITVKKLSVLTSIPEYSIREMAREGKLPAYKINKKSYLFDVDEVVQYIKKHRA